MLRTLKSLFKSRKFHFHLKVLLAFTPHSSGHVTPQSKASKFSKFVTESADFNELVEKEPWLWTSKLVVKPDMLFGKPALNLDLAQVASFVIERLGKEVKTVSVPTGVPLKSEIIAPLVATLPLETSASSKLTVLNPACRIWTMVAREVLVSSMPTQLEILDMHLSLETTQNTAEHQKKRSCINARVVIDRHNSSTKGEVGTARSSKDTHIREERRPQLSERSSEIAGTRESIGIPIQVYGSEETMTGICKQQSNASLQFA
ncbi:hypothetical protein K1719_041919 [Acacia pycnantha]|nr:hypothetical protein K1719_041919 [Acacia pycnantha]